MQKKPVKKPKSLFKFVLSAGALFLVALILRPSLSTAQGSAFQAPSFSETDIQGTTHSLESYEGKHLVLYFWATWCPACRDEVENMSRVFKEFKPRGIEFLSVSLDKDLAKLEDFIRQKRVLYPVLFDGLGWQNRMAGLYGISSTPSFILISPSGTVEGVGSWAEDLREKLLSIEP